MNPAISENDLHAYIDGMLDDAGIQTVEAYLKTHPEEAEKLRAYARQRAEIAAYLAAPGPVPLQTERLRRRLQGAMGLRRVNPWIGRAVAASLLIALGWGGNEALRQIEQSNGAVPVFANEAADAHSTIVGLDMPIWEVLMAEPASLAAFLARHGDTTLQLRDIKVDGLHTLGAQLVPWDYGTALQFVFEDSASTHRVTLFVAVANGADQALRTARINGVPVAFWQKGRVAYVLSGDLAEGSLVHYAHEIEEFTDSTQG
ncbi:MAG: hypothetical protein KJ904_18855 [Alphaproteobacteria bacterium]|nr:hypothetical protein [Alphaproteobacteria bacterium]MBU0797469.1 hypothetical protein [Alphaproteobacteria bacterium]MBU0889222.1 hypothetical protein [Alphaproteobacteria bacterium]MBU1813811.1 hypothetical protein [Alphaproteobacteria bacterium]